MRCILLWRADRGHLINLPNRFPYYSSSRARQIEAHFVRLQVSSGSFFDVIFKCIILDIFYFSSQWRTGALLSTHGWRNLIILNNTWQRKTTLKYSEHFKIRHQKIHTMIQQNLSSPHRGCHKFHSRYKLMSF